MTQLKDRIRARIAAEGPLSVAEYMAICLGDPDAGYYTTHEPFGSSGDFITAPEISQMFGELVGAACMAAYQAMGAPSRFSLVELGPGRGTLMADLLRIASLRPQFISAAQLCLIETSSRLRDVQKATLAKAPLEPVFFNRIQDLPQAPVIFVANEFFDALPIHQFVRTGDGWRERMIGLDTEGALTIGAGTPRLPDENIPAGFADSAEGTVLETQPAANAVAEEIGARLARDGGAALIIDYGYLKTAPGDTLQALYRHAFDDPLARPGEADLTAHVNFEALAAAAARSGATALPPLTQGEFLLRSGLLERAGALGAGKAHKEQEAIRDAVERLAAPEQMGNLFKVLALTGDGRSFPPFDSAG